MSHKYTTRVAVQNYLLKNIDESFHAQVDEWIEDISEYIDSITGRTFLASPTLEEMDESGAEGITRKFSGNGSALLKIDDCVEVISVTMGDIYGDDPVAITDYITLPPEAPTALPMKAILRKNGAVFTVGAGNVFVTGRWGYADAVPRPVRMAATILVANIYKFGRGGVKNGVASERIGNYQVTYANQGEADAVASAMESLDRYKRYDF